MTRQQIVARYQSKEHFRWVMRQYPELRLEGMLSKTSKIGDAARTFCLPLESTCLTVIDGQEMASPICRSHCYAYKMRDWGPGVEARAKTNHKIASRDDFAKLMSGALRRGHIGHFKLHGTGDFFSTAYLETWCRIMEDCSDVMFWTYTRAWKIPSFLPLLSELSELPNNKLHFSIDASDNPKEIPIIANRHLAWLALHSADHPPIKVDVVFPCFQQRRFAELTVMGKSVVCPHYSGRPLTSGTVDCVACRICLP